MICGLYVLQKDHASSHQAPLSFDLFIVCRSCWEHHSNVRNVPSLVLAEYTALIPVDKFCVFLTKTEGAAVVSSLFLLPFQGRAVDEQNCLAGQKTVPPCVVDRS